MRFGGDEKRVIDITDEHINYYFIITYISTSLFTMYYTFTPITALPFPTDGSINNRGQRHNLHFPLKFGREVVK